MELIVTNYDSMPLITCKKYTRPGSKVKFNIPSIGSKVKFNIPYEDILRGGGGQIAPPPYRSASINNMVPGINECFQVLMCNSYTPVGTYKD